MSDTIYRKVGGRYQPVGIEWCGWPSDGVWLCTDGRQSCIAKIGDVPDPMPLASIERHRDAACRAVSRMMACWSGGELLSPNDFVDEIFLEIVKDQADEPTSTF
jgi:hypothetical protein